MRIVPTAIARRSPLPDAPAATVRRLQSWAFTLVEVVLALGVATFALLPIIALLPIGLQTLQDAANETITAGIASQIRGELEQVSFNATTTDPTEFTLQNLCGNINTPYSPSTYSGWTYFYTQDGIKLNNDRNTNLGGKIPSNAYFQAVFTRQSITNTTLGMTFDPNNSAEMITVTLQYPVIPLQTSQSHFQRTVVFSMLAAKQNPD